MTSTTRTARCGPACRVVWEGIGQATWPPLSRFKIEKKGQFLPVHTSKRYCAIKGTGKTPAQFVRFLLLPHKHPPTLESSVGVNGVRHTFGI